MPKIAESGSLVRVHVMLDRDDWLTWKALFSVNIGESKALRLVIRDYLKKLERKVEESVAIR